MSGSLSCRLLVVLVIGVTDSVDTGRGAMQLNNKIAMITGGASGLGAGLARRFAEEGAAV